MFNGSKTQPDSVGGFYETSWLSGPAGLVVAPPSCSCSEGSVEMHELGTKQSPQAALARCRVCALMRQRAPAGSSPPVSSCCAGAISGTRKISPGTDRGTQTPCHESQLSLIYCWGLSKAVWFSTATLFLHTRIENITFVCHLSRRNVRGLHTAVLRALVKIKDYLWQFDFCRNFLSLGPRDRNRKTREAFNLPVEG